MQKLKNKIYKIFNKKLMNKKNKSSNSLKKISKLNKNI